MQKEPICTCFYLKSCCTYCVHCMSKLPEWYKTWSCAQVFLDFSCLLSTELHELKLVNSEKHLAWLGRNAWAPSQTTNSKDTSISFGLVLSGGFSGLELTSESALCTQCTRNWTYQPLDNIPALLRVKTQSPCHQFTEPPPELEFVKYFWQFEDNTVLCIDISQAEKNIPGIFYLLTVHSAHDRYVTLNCVWHLTSLFW